MRGDYEQGTGASMGIFNKMCREGWKIFALIAHHRIFLKFFKIEPVNQGVLDAYAGSLQHAVFHRIAGQAGGG